MKISEILKKLFTGACIYYSAASVALILLKLILSGAQNSVISVISFLLLFPFGLTVSGAQMVYRRSPLPSWSRLLLHFLMILSAFFLFLWLPAQSHASAGSTLVALFLLTVAYWVVFLIVKLTVKRFHSIKEE